MTPVSHGRRGLAEPRSRRARCLAVVCRAVLLGAFVIVGFAAMSAFEAAAAEADCEAECGFATVTVPETDPAARISLVDATVGQTTALVGATAPTLAPAIEQVGSVVRTATTAATAVTRTVDTVVRDTVTTVSRTLDSPVTNALTGTVSAIAPVVSSTGLQPRVEVPGVVTITATVTVSEGSETSSAPRRPAPAASAAPQQAPVESLPVPSAPAAPLDGDCVFCVNKQHEPSSFQSSTATAAPAGIGSQRPVDRLPLGFPAAPVSAVGPGVGTSSAGSNGGHAQGAIVLPGRSAHDQRIACWTVGPDHIAPLRKRAQQPPVSPD
ncbi:hypothetical protein [Amycolatopsis keratiniphila]|uniref:hypothetical protein n=1 Tax=Amycolatopsis keratiniphila TaxID=129921 RepID=UPI00130E4F85|nr:hypothetical protein [Amycolatopsis keratiniphila]